MPASVLVVQHEPECPPGHVGQGLSLAGLELDVRHPYAGQPLPADLAGHPALVVLGGHMGADDDADFPWLCQTKALVRQAATAGIPTLGICLGHQLAAVALGGVVGRNPRGYRRGVLEMGWTAATSGDPVLAGCGPKAVQWHHDVVVADPPGTTVLGRATTGELLAARFAPTVWGVQCHPEADAGVVAAWARGDRLAAETPDELARIEDAFAQVQDEEDERAESWAPLARDFAAVVLG